MNENNTDEIKINIMRKKFFLIILSTLIILLIAVIPFHKRITGLVTDIVSLALGIAPSTFACNYFIIPSEVLQNSIVNVSVYCMNCGSQNYTGYTEVELRDINENLISLTRSPEYTLDVNEEKFLTFSFSAFYSPGEYKGIARCYFDGKVTEVKKTFRIYVLPPPPLVPPPAPAPPQIPLVPDISVEYPEFLNLTQATDYTILIKVVNNGTATLHNLTLTLESEEIKTEVVYPKSVPRINVGDSVLFVIKLSVPVELPEGNYTIGWNVYAEKIQRKGEIIAYVRVLEIKERAKELIGYYSGLIEYLENEIKSLEKDGKNVSLARELLLDSKIELNGARELYNLRFYSECLEKLEVVRKKIEATAIEVARLKILPPPPPKPIIVLPVWLPIWLLILLLVVVIAIVVLLRRRRYRIVRLRRF